MVVVVVVVGVGGGAFWGRFCCSRKGVDCARRAGVASEWSHAAVSPLTWVMIGLLRLFGWLTVYITTHTLIVEGEENLHTLQLHGAAGTEGEKT